MLAGDANRSCLPLYATFAEGLVALGGKKEASDVASTALGLCPPLWESADVEGQMAGLRLLALLSQSSSGPKTTASLASAFLTGGVGGDAGPADLVRARKKAWAVVTESLLPAYPETLRILADGSAWLALAFGSPAVAAAEAAAVLLLELDKGAERPYAQLLQLTDSFLSAQTPEAPMERQILAADRRRILETLLRLTQGHAAVNRLLPTKLLKGSHPTSRLSL